MQASWGSWQGVCAAKGEHWMYGDLKTFNKLLGNGMQQIFEEHAVSMVAVKAPACFKHFESLSIMIPVKDMNAVDKGQDNSEH